MKLLLLLPVLMAGCKDATYEAREKFAVYQVETEIRSRENCLKRGGSVIVSSWDNSMKDCKVGP